MKERKSPFNIVKKRNLFFIITAAIILSGLLSIFIRGFNVDIDFAGGTAFHFNMKRELTTQDLSDISAIFEGELGEKPSSIQKTGDAGSEVIVKTKEVLTEQRDAVFAILSEKYGLTEDDRLSVDNVSAVVGGELRNRAVLATLVAALAILIYITIRFDLWSGLAAIICLLIDLFMVITAYTVFQIPLNMTFIAVLLTILGYSINANIIVFDRVRENLKLSRKEPFADIMDRSVWQTMTRTVNTTLTTLITVTMVFIIGVDSVKDFALPLIVGIASGLYTSVFLGGNFWNMMYREKRVQGKLRAKTR